MPKEYLYRVLRGNQFEHTHNHVQGKAVPVAVPDDTVYVKMNKGFQPTRLRILCAGCGRKRSACHCAADVPDTSGQVVQVQAERRGETPPAPPPLVVRPASVPSGRLGTFQSEAHAGLACRACGYVSCTCPVPQPGSTLDAVVVLQRAQGKR